MAKKIKFLRKAAYKFRKENPTLYYVLSKRCELIAKAIRKNGVDYAG